jgi:hypothetical protein
MFLRGIPHAPVCAARRCGVETLALTATLLVALALPAIAAHEIVRNWGTLAAGDENARTGFPGDFAERALDPWELVDRDFVRVECMHEGGRLIAPKITVPEMRTP